MIIMEMERKEISNNNNNNNNKAIGSYARIME